MHRILKVFLLILVLLLNVRVYVSIFGLLIFNEVVETLVDRNFEHLMVVNILYHLVNGVFERTDFAFVVANDSGRPDE